MRMETIKTSSARSRSDSGGFTLVASLLLLLLLSGIALGLMMMVNTEGKVGGTDLQNNLAFHAAEGGIEKMYSDLSAVFQSTQSPSPTQICNVGSTSNAPAIVGVTWTQYSVMPGTTQQSTCPTTLTSVWGQISGNGPDAGLWAQVMPVNMLVTAAFPGGQEVSMTRTSQVALIPVFQFGVFCEGDCGFFDSPNLTFGGRVHTNSDLYLGVSNGATLVFNNKLEAYGNVVTEKLPNGLGSTGGNWDDTGNVYVPTQNNGCSNPGVVTTDCTLKAANSDPVSSPYGDGSVQGVGGNPVQSTYNASVWNTFSKTTTNKMVINGNYGSLTNIGTGAKKLSMPFVTGTTFPYEIIRRARSTDSSALSQSREENLAQIHVLLSDDPAELPSGSVRLANINSSENGGASNPYGIATSRPTGTNSYFPTALSSPAGGNSYAMYFAAATNGWLPDPTSCAGAACPILKCTGGVTCSTQYLPPDWYFAPSPAPSGAQTLQPTTSPAAPLEVVGTTNPSVNYYPTFALCYPVSGTWPSGCSTTAPAYPYFVVQNQNNAAVWNLIDGYLYVEYEDSSGLWHNVTNEWLGLGFARGMTPPTAPGTNPINPNAILLLQEPADRNGNSSFSSPVGVPDPTGIAPHCSAWNAGHTACTGTWTMPLPPEVFPDAASGTPYFGLTTTATPAPATGSTTYAPNGQSISMFNWYPINFYDAREGEVRAGDQGNNSCTTNGLLNAVEIDVGNLNQWLLGNIGTSGKSVNTVTQNGYILYFSDRRGMLPNPGVGYKTGESGLEDVINANYAGDNSVGAPDGHLEPAPAGHSTSPEDVNQNGTLDMFGTANLGLGQWSGTMANATGLIGSAANQNVQIVAATPDNPFSPRMAACASTARKNWVSGARHVLKLVDGSLGNVPMGPTTTVVAGVTYHGGFTVASENPVYIQGNYNSNSADTFFTKATSTGVPGPDMTSPYHSAASVIADTVTVLSNEWNDETSMVGINGNSDVTYAPSGGPWAGNREIVNDSYYRLAVAAGKNMAFTFPSWANSIDYGFGTDGGIHNFLHFLEDWSGNKLNYGGSLVSLYYSTYNTGVFKCCTYSVYYPPTRNYLFDADFTNPAGLPPGTPMFRDVESLSYRQMFTARASGQ
ncbi:MAG: hypothetical protein WCA58_18055 [Terriglobales bacterium]